MKACDHGWTRVLTIILLCRLFLVSGPFNMSLHVPEAHQQFQVRSLGHGSGAVEGTYDFALYSTFCVSSTQMLTVRGRSCTL